MSLAYAAIDIGSPAKSRSKRLFGDRLDKQHLRSWEKTDQLLAGLAAALALALLILAAVILRHEDKLLLTTDPDILKQGSLIKGAWLTLQSACIMIILVPVATCVSTIKAEEWIRTAREQPASLAHVSSATSTLTSAYQTFLYAQHPKASHSFRLALCLSLLAFAISTVSHGLMFISEVMVSDAQRSLEVAALLPNQIVNATEFDGAWLPTTESGRFPEEQATRLASFLLLDLQHNLSLAESNRYTVSSRESQTDENTFLAVATPKNATRGAVYESDVITFSPKCTFHAPEPFNSFYGGMRTIRYTPDNLMANGWFKITVEDGTEMALQTSSEMPLALAPIARLESSNSLLDYSSRGYAAWVLAGHPSSSNVRLDGLPVTVDYPTYNRERNVSTTILVCDPQIAIKAGRITYDAADLRVEFLSSARPGNIDDVQVGYIFSSLLAAFFRVPGSTSNLASDDAFSKDIVMMTRDANGKYANRPRPIEEIQKNIGRYWYSVTKAYLNGALAKNTMTVSAVMPVQGLVLSTSKTNLYACIGLSVLLLTILAVASWRTVLPPFELLPALEVCRDVLKEGGESHAEKAYGFSNEESLMSTAAQVIWNKETRRFDKVE